MKKLVLSLSLVLISSAALAQDFKVTTVEIQPSKMFQVTDPTFPFDQFGQIIATAERVVALGESVYRLVQHGKPSNTVAYAPISIVPRDPVTKEVVNPFDMEDCSMPVRKTFNTIISTAGIEVVNFKYMLTFSHSCSYNGVGKYLQAVEIKPVSIETGYGWDVEAAMKLSGIMNHGKKTNPIVGANLTMSYTTKSWRKSFTEERTIYINGEGKIDAK